MNLFRLARQAQSPVYVVGGAVRDALFGLIEGECAEEVLRTKFRRADGDVDLCGTMNGEELTAALGDDYTVTEINAAFGTYRILGGGVDAEYARFRKDVYAVGGKHVPSKVSFGCTLAADAKRRDFSCNAVYYDLTEETAVDPVGGAGDIGQGILRQVASDTLCHDGVRLLRLARFKLKYGWVIERETLASARANAPLIDDLTETRIASELNKTVFIGRENEAVEILKELGIFERLSKRGNAAEGQNFFARFRQTCG